MESLHDRDQRILKLREQKRTHSQIARELELPKDTVRYVLRVKCGISGPANDWTSEFWNKNTDKLIEMYEAGTTYLEIGETIGATKSAVTGRIHTLIRVGRLMAKERPMNVAVKAIVLYEPVTQEPPRRPCKPLPASMLRHFTCDGGVGLDDVGAGCRWPYDPVDDGWRYCGAPATATYCDRHQRLSLQATSTTESVPSLT